MGYIKNQGHFEACIQKAINVNLEKLDKSALLPICEYTKLIYGKKCMNDFTYKIWGNPNLLESYHTLNYLKENNKTPFNMFENSIIERTKQFRSDFQGFLKNLYGKPGVYIFENYRKQALYIGVSINLQDRILSSFAERELFFKGAKVFIKVCLTQNKADAHILEMYFINLLKPILNTTGNYKETPTLRILNIPKFSETIEIKRKGKNGTSL